MFQNFDVFLKMSYTLSCMLTHLGTFFNSCFHWTRILLVYASNGLDLIGICALNNKAVESKAKHLNHGLRDWCAELQLISKQCGELFHHKVLQPVPPQIWQQKILVCVIQAFIATLLFYASIVFWWSKGPRTSIGFQFEFEVYLFAQYMISTSVLTRILNLKPQASSFKL